MRAEFRSLFLPNAQKKSRNSVSKMKKKGTDYLKCFTVKITFPTNMIYIETP